MAKFVENGQICANQLLGADTWELIIKSPEIAKTALPGQFLQLQIEEGVYPLLRRPFGVADVDVEKSLIKVIYRAGGYGTNILTKVKMNDCVNCLGPLGKGFSLDAKKPLIIGGGVGLAPLIYLTKALPDAHVIVGARNKAESFWYYLIKHYSNNVLLTTDDGSAGLKGNVVTGLNKILTENNFDKIYTCGPEPMMKAVYEVAKVHNIDCEVSLEKHMACGMGACLSCTCEKNDGHRMKVCTEGPVVNGREVF